MNSDDTLWELGKLTGKSDAKMFPPYGIREVARHNVILDNVDRGMADKIARLVGLATTTVTHITGTGEVSQRLTIHDPKNNALGNIHIKDDDRAVLVLAFEDTDPISMVRIFEMAGPAIELFNERSEHPNAFLIRPKPFV